MRNTQAFVVMDKSEDANAVVVSFRGTEPFNAYDWSTDLDFSWVKLEGLGGVHLEHAHPSPKPDDLLREASKSAPPVLQTG